MSAARLPLTILMITISPPAAVILDLLVMNLLVLQMLEGPMLAYPELILSHTSSLSLFPVGLGNPFVSWTEEAQCHPTEAMIRLMVGCIFLYNYGEDIIVLTVTLLINVIIGLAGHAIL